jgi:hypothetical protein
MSASIIPLPGAAAAPVPSAKLGPGRPPKNVASIRRGVQIRAFRRLHSTHADELEASARRYREAAESMRETIAFALHEAAVVEAQARALREAPR